MGVTEVEELPDQDLQIGVLLALLQDDAKNQSSYLTWKEGRPQTEVAATLRRDFLVSEERADKLSGAWGRHPLLGRMYLPAYRAGTEVVAELRRKYPPAKVLPVLYGCSGLVDVVTVAGARRRERGQRAKSPSSGHCRSSPRSSQETGSSRGSRCVKTVALGQLFRTAASICLAEVVAALDRPGARHEHVHRDEAARARDARADRVEEDALLLEGSERRRSPPGAPRRAARVSSSARPVSRTSLQPVQTMLTATANAISGSRRSHPVSATSAMPATTPHGGPDVGQEMVGVGAQRDRAQAPAGAQEGDGDDRR